MTDINIIVERLESINSHLMHISSIVKLICCCIDVDLEMIDFNNIMEVTNEIVNIQSELLNSVICDLMKAGSCILEESGERGNEKINELSPIEKSAEVRKIINPEYAATIDDLVSIINYKNDSFAIACNSFNFGYYQGTHATLRSDTN